MTTRWPRKPHRAELPPLPPDDPRHGTPPGYSAGCNEKCCRQAKAAYQAALVKDRLLGRPRKYPAVGAQRRIRAMAAMGWTLQYQARYLGKHPRAMAQVLSSRTWLSATKHEQIKAMCHDLGGRIGPDQKWARIARARGWPTIAAWDDDTIDDPAARPMRPRPVTGRRARTAIDPDNVEKLCTGGAVPNATPAEHRAAVKRLRAQGMHDGQIARRTRLNRRTVVRIRRELGLPAVPDAQLMAGAA